jgi:hypothetical protein
MNMKTVDFIEKQAGIIREGGRSLGKCASVFAEGGTIFSYGYHYPLLFRLTRENGKVIMVLNRAGYSNTTAKHIGYAGRFSDISAIIPKGTIRSKVLLTAY